MRELAPVKTACMHGSPLSRYDNRDLWKNFDYHELGIIGEPYFDIDFNEVLYLTDTGRRWDGDKVSIRDRVSEVASSQKSVVSSQESGVSSQESVDSSKKTKAMKKMKLHSTMDIIKTLENGLLPDKIMLTIHPQRWSDRFIPWANELVWQNVKNGVKYFVARGSS